MQYRALPIKAGETLDAEDLPVHRKFNIGGDDPLQNNQARAEAGLVVLRLFAEMMRNNYIPESFGDLLGDLMHAADALDLSFDEMLERGQRYYQEEINGEL